ncbi:MAG: transcription-repair coupling factor [Propionibacteriaceae bacterium]|nr:transcription-repair coupling factor [Propionibacteriaceae bacterium]
MRLSGLVELFAKEPTVATCLESQNPTLDITLPPAARPLLIAALAAKRESPLLVVTSTYRQAEDIATAVSSVMSDADVAYYPAWETLPHERLSPRSDTVGRRLTVLRRLANNDVLPAPKVVVAPVRALLQPQVVGLSQLIPVTLRVGAEYELTQLANDLVLAAYSRVDLVQRRGEFSVRGGIIDIFPPTTPHPVRVDFFGDTIEEITPFSVADQRSLPETLPEVIATPCRELLITDHVKQRAAQWAQHYRNISGSLGELFERISQGHAVEGMEALAPALVSGMELFVDVLPQDSLVLVSDPERVRARAHELTTTSDEFLHASWEAAATSGKQPIDFAAAAYRQLADVRQHALTKGTSWWSMSAFASEDENLEVTAGETDSLRLDAKPAQLWTGDTEGALAAVAASANSKRRCVLVADSVGLAKRFSALLGEREIPVQTADTTKMPKSGLVEVVVADLTHGFSLPKLKLDIFTVGDLSGQTDTEKSQRRIPARRKAQIDPLELVNGDPIVHELHGVGRYVELTQRSVAGATREYLVIEYAASRRGHPADRLYVPMDQLHLITRYVGGEMPTLDKLGGADWNRRKAKARRAVREIAAELIKLYAARQASVGHAFAPDSPWQAELEDAFAYIETPDQLTAVTDVKADMERITPMDRLICGDVGYGKTEIAVRAAFKAVMDGKQVAVLVPTTLLVQQHLATFGERYAGFPITIAALSRFQTESETKKVLQQLADGVVDVVIGTHRLIGSDVKFKDLGLVVIDEEQRFGVEHKEALKKLRLNVDVLAMSATPIPRTLEMAVTGIREMSVIATPPEERHPVLTFAGPYDAKQIRAAIRRELAREGQVFYIHNRVASISKAAEQLSELVPEARVAVAHGQLGEHTLEQVMIDFWERRYDVLVCTTIIEAGLDINTANTLLIERADLLGLSQLHQLRGRVGRGRERGYAYFFFPGEKPLTETAHDRLATMAAQTELGAGMSIAMKDLEIRGAGNLLGGEQSGHIAEVGFDLYLRLVGEAVADFQSEAGEPEPEIRIELPIAAHLPPDYIQTERLRLEIYKRIAQVKTDSDIAALHEELQDRYGSPPAVVETLLQVASLRLLAKSCGLGEIALQGTSIRFAPVDLPESRQVRLKRLYPSASLRTTSGSMLIPRPTTAPIAGKPIKDMPLLSWVRKVLTDIF